MPELTVAEIANGARNGLYSIPEFQREFVWRRQQVAALADSLSRGYPVGCLVLWQTAVPQDPLWIIDGQQRVTAFCILFGRAPSWGPSGRWDNVLRISRCYLNVTSDGQGVIGGRKRGALNIDLAEILKCENQDDLDETIASALDEASDPEVTDDLRGTLLRMAEAIFQIREVSIPIVVTDMTDEMELATAYQRLNELGTRIRETDTQLAFIAIRNPGWVRDEFRGFIRKLEDMKWPVSPGGLLRVMTILYRGTPRVGNIREREKFWEAAPRIFSPIKTALEDVLERLERYGVHTLDEIPSEYSFIALVALHTKFSNMRGYDFGQAFKWFVATNLSGRFGDAPLETLSTDGKIIYDGDSFADVMERLEIFENQVDFKAMLESKFSKRSPQALLLKTLLWGNAIDWKRGGKLSTTPPLEWHHIVPKKVCSTLGFEKGSENKVANLTLLSTDANKAFKDLAPWVYAPRDILDRNRITSHWVPEEYADKFMAGQSLGTGRQFEDFLNKRESLIAAAATKLLGLRSRDAEANSP